MGRLLLVIVVLGVGLWLFGPYEPAELAVDFDEDQLSAGADAYFAAQEARFDDITPGVQKQVIWASKGGSETRWSILYVHGFSATSQEIRPVPDEVAVALGANLVFTRLAGHGRPGAALADVTVNDWMRDVAEGLAIAREAGEQVLVISAGS